MAGKKPERRGGTPTPTPAKYKKRTNTDSLNSIWITGPQSVNTVVDNYGKKIDEVYKYIKDEEVARIVELWEKSKHKGKGLFEDFISAISLKSIGIDFTGDDLKQMLDNGKRIVDTVREGLDVAKMIQDGQYGAALDKMSGVLGDGITKVLREGVNAYTLFKNSDLHSIEGINSFIANLTGVDVLRDSGLLDIQAKAVAILEAAQKLGFKDAIEKLKEKITFNHPGLQRRLGRGLEVNARLGQIETMQAILSMINAKAATTSVPDLIGLTLRHYKFPIDFKSEKIPEYKKQLLDVLRSLDNEWDRKTVDGETMMLVAPWIGASQNAKTLFLSDKEYADTVAIASSYRAVDSVTLLNEMYPHLRLA